MILQFFSITAVLMNLSNIHIWKCKSKLCWDKFTFVPQNIAYICTLVCFYTVIINILFWIKFVITYNMRYCVRDVISCKKMSSIHKYYDAIPSHKSMFDQLVFHNIFLQTLYSFNNFMQFLFSLYLIACNSKIFKKQKLSEPLYHKHIFICSKISI